MMRARKITRLLVFFVLWLLAGSGIATATHLHTGTLSWQRDLTYVSVTDIKIRLTITLGLRWSFSYPGSLSYVGGPNPPVGTMLLNEVQISLNGAGYSNPSLTFPVEVINVSS